MATGASYFLPYQQRWLADNSRIKIWEKSRRIGATYVASFEDVRDAHAGTVPACWFSSADESAAREYIEYCEKWAKLYNYAAQSLGEQVIDESKGVKTYQIRFKNGVKIHALSSNPKAFRSKGGKITQDEFAWHEDAKGMWAAARPCITWGHPLRILSTHNGVTSLYNEFIKKIKAGKLKWALHTTDIFIAVKEGLADKILKRTLTDAERAAWIENERESVADDNAWAEEYCCQPQDEKTAFLTYEMITALQREDILRDLSELTDAELYAGMDIGRHHDLTVIWIVEKVGGFYVTRVVIELRKTPFREQKQILYEILAMRNLRRLCGDSTGLGMQLMEEAREQFGASRVESVGFTGPVKEELAYGFLTHAQDKDFAIPISHEIRADFHSIRKVTTAAGNIRFDVAASEAKESHADRFWAAALALHAATAPSSVGALEVESRPRHARDADDSPDPDQYTGRANYAQY